jgi:DNA-binding LytR/AlgR family response regulator
MKGKKYIIIDDLSADAEYLKQQLITLPFLEPLAVCSTIEDAIGILTAQPVDLLFLDVRLGSKSGLSLLESFPNLPPVIIVSAYREYAIDSYNIGKAADYILKPFTYERLLMAVNRALSIKLASNSMVESDFIFLKMGRVIRRFDFDTVEYVEGYGIYSKVCDAGQVYVVNERMMTMADLLPSQLFMRVHKSYIINISKILTYDRHHLFVGQTEIPIGSSYRPRLEGLLRLFDKID